MSAMAYIEPGATLFGGVTVHAWVRTGTGGRYSLHHADFDNMQDAQKFAWECDRNMLLHKVSQFLEQATNGMSFRWYSQRKWIEKARPQIHEIRGYYSQMQRYGITSVELAQLAELVEIALLKSRPFEHIQAAVTLWVRVGNVAQEFHEKYNITMEVSNG